MRLKVAKLGLGRKVQTPYDSFFAPKDHGDSLIVKAQEWIEQHHTQTIDYEKLAERFKMSRRSLERRFKQATVMTPLGYQQRFTRISG